MNFSNHSKFHDGLDLFLKDIHGEIRKIAEFINVVLTDDEIEEIVQNTSFKHMKAESGESTDELGKPAYGITMFRKGANDHFFYKDLFSFTNTIGFLKNSGWLSAGEVGDWKNHLTIAESELIDANVERVLGDTDIKFIYELWQSKY